MPLVRIDISKTASRERVGRRPSRISSTAAADVQILRLRRTLKTDPRAPSIIRAECDVAMCLSFRRAALTSALKP